MKISSCFLFSLKLSIVEEEVGRRTGAEPLLSIVFVWWLTEVIVQSVNVLPVKQLGGIFANQLQVQYLKYDF